MKLIGFVLALMCANTTGHAQTPVDIIAPQSDTFNLANGMQVVVIPDHRAPVVTHMVWYKIGASDEVPGKSGIAHFLEHLMFKGTKLHPSGQFSTWLSQIGGQENAFTSNDYTAFYQRTEKRRLPQLMEFEADRMEGLVLTDEVVLPERDVIVEERRQVIEQKPEAILAESMLAALYLNHPYGTPVIGWMHEMQQLTTKDALDFYGKYYTPNNAILVVAGDVTTADVKKLAEATYGKLPRRSEPPLRKRPVEPVARAAREVELVDQRLKQVGWSRIYLVPSYSSQKNESAPALEVLEEILGGNTGRIYQKLVVEKGIAAGASVSYSGQGLDSGRFSIDATPKSTADFAAVTKEVDAIVKDVFINGVTAEELERARASLLATSVYAEDSQTYLARLFGGGLATGLSFEAIRNWPQSIAAVTPAAIKDAAHAWLQKERSVTGLLMMPPPADAEPAKPKTEGQAQ